MNGRCCADGAQDGRRRFSAKLPVRRDLRQPPEPPAIQQFVCHPQRQPTQPGKHLVADRGHRQRVNDCGRICPDLAAQVATASVMKAAMANPSPALTAIASPFGVAIHKTIHA